VIDDGVLVKDKVMLSGYKKSPAYFG